MRPEPMNQNSQDFEAAIADVQCCLTIIGTPGTSQADREIACLMLSTAVH